jgi:hypothetical protein
MELYSSWLLVLALAGGWKKHALSDRKPENAGYGVGPFISAARSPLFLIAVFAPLPVRPSSISGRRSSW